MYKKYSNRHRTWDKLYKSCEEHVNLLLKLGSDVTIYIIMHISFSKYKNKLSNHCHMKTSTYIVKLNLYIILANGSTIFLH